MTPLLAAALPLLAKYAPDLVGSVFKSQDAEYVAKNVISIAEDITGYKGETALEQIEEDNYHNQFKEKLTEKFAEVLELETKDIQHARENNKYHDTTVKAIKTALWMNPILIVAAIAFLGFIVLYTELDSGSLSMLSALIGAFVNQLYQERQQVFNFLVGSSLGSKLKTMFGDK